MCVRGCVCGVLYGYVCTFVAVFAFPAIERELIFCLQSYPEPDTLTIQFRGLEVWGMVVVMVVGDSPFMISGFSIKPKETLGLWIMHTCLW